MTFEIAAALVAALGSVVHIGHSEVVLERLDVAVAVVGIVEVVVVVVVVGIVVATVRPETLLVPLIHHLSF